MTNEEVMQMMTDMGLHEGGIENWLMDNAWYLVVNKAVEAEREICASMSDWILKEGGGTWGDAIRARGQA
jgi:hypothetical protein